MVRESTNLGLEQVVAVAVGVSCMEWTLKVELRGLTGETEFHGLQGLA